MKGKRTCRTCGKTKGYSGFTARGRTYAGKPAKRAYTCRACVRKAEREREREQRRWRKHGRECAACGQRAPFPDEIGAGRGAKCLTCRRRHRAEKARRARAMNPQAASAAAMRWRARHPDRAKDATRKWRERVMADPERRAELVINHRITERIKRGQGRLMPAVGGYVPPTPHPRGNGTQPSGRRLDAAPLAAWLRREFPFWPATEVARIVGVDERTVSRLTSGEARTVSLHIADRIFVKADCTHLLAVLYPPDDRKGAAA
jgi:hypothetical protein